MQDEEEIDEDEMLGELVAELDAPKREPAGGMEGEETGDEFSEPISPVLVDRQDGRPAPLTVCRMCPNSLWFSTAEDRQCFCKLMHSISYNDEQPTLLTACDGLLVDLQR